MDAGAHLLELIRSLKPTEKRLFTLRAGALGGDSSYLRLYQFLASHPMGDDAAIRQAFAGEPFLQQLAVAKNYLYHQLLDTLHGYDRGKSPSLDLADRLTRVELLFRRSLHAAALQQAVQGSRQARLLDMPLKEVEFLRWEMRLHRVLGGEGLVDRLQELHAREQAALASVEQERALVVLHDETYGLLLARNTLTPARIADERRRILAHPLLADAQAQRLGFDARIMAGYVRTWAAVLVGDHIAHWQAQQALLKFWEGNAHRMRLEPERYLRTMTGYLQSCMNAAQLQEVPATIAKLRRLLKLHSELRRTDGFRVYLAEWTYLMSQYELRAARKVVPELTAAMEAHKGLAPQFQASVLANLALMWFQLEQWDESRRKIEVLLRKHVQHLQPPLRLSLRLVRMLCMLELVEYEQAARQVRALRKELNRAPEADALAMRLLDLIHPLCAETTEAERTQSLRQLQQALAAPAAQGLPHQKLLLAWTTSRAEETDLLQTLKQLDH